MSIVLDLQKVDRATALKTWLAYHGVEAKTLADRLGVHRGTVSRLISGERSSAVLIESLVEMGIPRDLLPVPSQQRVKRNRES